MPSNSAFRHLHFRPLWHFMTGTAQSDCRPICYRHNATSLGHTPTSALIKNEERSFIRIGPDTAALPRRLPTMPDHRLSLQIVRRHPRTAEILRDFPALKLEPFLEPRASWTWNRKQVTREKL